jgi:hypothetical protein
VNSGLVADERGWRCGAVVCLQKTGHGGTIEGHMSDTVANSQAVQASFKADNSCFSAASAFPGAPP